MLVYDKNTYALITLTTEYVQEIIMQQLIILEFI